MTPSPSEPAAAPRRTVLFVNDRGFVAGAGIATRRQMLSLAGAGHAVALAFAADLAPHHTEAESAAFQDLPGQFLGYHPLPPVPRLLEEPKLGWLQDRAFDRLRAAIETVAPDLVVFGNLHGANWPVRWLSLTRDLGVAVAAYTHDLFYLTGRCAHPVDCRKHLTGCDETCPTPSEYPPQLPHQIRAQWEERETAFTGDAPIPILTNSDWTTRMVRERFPAHPAVRRLPLGLDEILFAPQIKSVARGLLKLPGDGFVVLICAWNYDYGPKGGALLHAIRDGILALPGAHILLIGSSGRDISDITGDPRVTHLTNLHPDLMPLAYSAADVYAMFSSRETFGQTALEAAACAAPIVAFAAGGVVDIARDGINARVIRDFSAEALIGAIAALYHDAPLRRAMGRAGRAIAATEYSLAAQARGWEAMLADLLPSDEGSAS